MSQIDPASVLYGPNATFIAELYSRFLQDAGAVDESWRQFFTELRDEAPAVLAELHGPEWAPNQTRIVGEANGHAAAGNGHAALAPAVAALGVAETRQATLDSVRALMLIRSYRIRGHLEAKLDPLGLEKREEHPELDPKTYGFTDADLDRPIFIDNVLGLETATPREILSILRDTYCGSIGVEFMHIQDPDQKSWIQRKLEGAPWLTAFGPAEK